MSKKVTNEIIEVAELPIKIENDSTYFIKQQNPNYLTHSYFKYPCKFIPEIPKWAIRKYSSDETIVYDPFVGSGTTLLESLLFGLPSIGREIDPIARLISKVKTHTLNIDDFQIMDDFVQEVSFKIENKIKIDNPFVPEINNLDHWFTERNIQELGIIKKLIDTVENDGYKDFLKVCFISIIRKCSNADEMSPKPYVSSKFPKIPRKPLAEFLSTYKNYKISMLALSKKAPNAKVVITDKNPEMINVDFLTNLVITSPPYINAFDYVRILRLENLWLNFFSEQELLNNKKKYVGTERISIEKERNNLEILNESNLLRCVYSNILQVDEKRAFVVKKFFNDIRNNLLDVNKVLANNGVYCIVIGNNVIRNNLIENWIIISEMAKSLGYEKVLHFSYVIKNPYLRIPRNGIGGKINKDHVLVLQK